MAAQEPVFIKCAWRLLPFMMLLYFVNIMDRVNVGFAALTMNHDLNFGPEVFGFGAGIFFIGYALFQVPANAILERVGARRWIFCILLGWGALSALNAAVTTPNSFYAVRVALGLIEAGFFPGMILYLTYWFTKSFQARLVSFFMLSLPFANAVGGPLSTTILGSMGGVGGLAGWQWMFLIEGAPAVILAIATLYFLPDSPAKAAWLDDGEKRLIAERLKTDDTAQHRDFLPALADPKVYALGVVYFGYAVGLYGVTLWLPQIVAGMGVSTRATGFVVALPYLLGMAVMTLWSRSSDKRNERIWHVALPAMLMVASLLIASQAASNLVIFICLSLVLVGALSLQGPFWVLPSSFLSGAAAAGGIAVINSMGTGGGGFVGPYVMGLFKKATGGYSAGILALAVGPFLTAVIVLILGAAAKKRRTT